MTSVTSKPQSMTGFGSAQVTAGDRFAVRCDIRSVNGKGLDVKLRLPSGLEALEQRVKKRVADFVSRGNVQLSLNVEVAAGDGAGFAVDQGALATLYAQAKAAAQALGAPAPSIDTLLGVRGIITTDEGGGRLDADDVVLREAILSALDEALYQFRQSREAEGVALVDILTEHLDATNGLVARASADEDSQPTAIKSRFDAQLAALLNADAGMDAQRVAGEVAVLVTKADVREEIDRLKTHIEAARALLEDGATIGRRLDFLIQEFNREANTLCSKSVSKGLTAIGLEMKSVIDQMREQVQNLQ